MPACWLPRCKINDPVEQKKYTDRAPEIVAQLGGKVLARGGRYQVMEGTDRFHRFVVIDSPTPERTVKCHQSPKHQAAAALRRAPGISESEQVVVESGDAIAV
jgi:uncharacterized protein (DUF1330 family)